MDILDPLETAYNYLRSQGASCFADVLHQVLSIKAAFYVSIMILAPTDSAIKRLELASGKRLADIMLLKPGIDILENHITILPVQPGFSMFTSINWEHYGWTKEDFIAMKIKAETTIDLSEGDSSCVRILVVDSIIIHDDQLDLLRRA